jgi:hypothetical protein
MSDFQNSTFKPLTPAKTTKEEQAIIRSRSRSREKTRIVEEKSDQKPETMEEESKEIEMKFEPEIFKIPEAFQRELSNDFLRMDFNEEIPENPFTFKLQTSTERPQINLNYGDNRQLIEEKNKITQYRNIWEDRIKHLISDYELIDIYRPEGKAKYNASIIKFMDYRKIKRNYLSSERSLSEVFSRAYFKLNEVLQISDIMKEYKGFLTHIT